VCDIGKPLEIIDVVPLAVPAPLRRETETPVEQPVPVEVPLAQEIPVPEGATLSPVAGAEGTAFPLL